MHPVTVLVLVIAVLVVVAVVISARRRRPGPAPDSAADGVEQVMVLWDQTAPAKGELAKIVEQALPGHKAHEVRIEQGNNPSLSYGLANWHVYQDEQAGRLSPGAWRRAEQRPVLNTSRGRRLVTVVPSGGAHVSAARNEWAHEIILRHVARVELEIRPDLMDRAAWRRMISLPVRDFILGLDADLVQHGTLTGHAQSFGDLDVIVSLVGITDPGQIRDRLLPGGYMSALDKLLRETGVRLNESDVAHWILCRGRDDEDTRAHLSYLPPRGTSALVAWDLLSTEEQSGIRKLG